jgi:periplasmic mercuric ion binding protein
MKKTIIHLSILFIFTISFAYGQTDKKKPTEEISFEVSGVCNMCKTRIEEAALYTAGVKFAEWNKKTQMLKVAYKTKKVDENTIHKNIAAAGHDTEEVKATDEAYAKLPGCCKYRDDVDVH